MRRNEESSFVRIYCERLSERETAKKFRIRDIKIKQLLTFKNLGNVLTESGKCDTEIRRCIGIAKYVFAKQNQVLRTFM